MRKHERRIIEKFNTRLFDCFRFPTVVTGLPKNLNSSLWMIASRRPKRKRENGSESLIILTTNHPIGNSLSEIK